MALERLDTALTLNTILPSSEKSILPKTNNLEKKQKTQLLSLIYVYLGMDRIKRAISYLVSWNLSLTSIPFMI